MTHKDVFITRKYTHAGINLLVNIDFVKKTISFVEKKDHAYPTKKWLFAERGTAYEQGWLNILEAMELATVAAMAELKYRKAEDDEEAAKMMIKLEKEMKN